MDSSGSLVCIPLRMELSKTKIKQVILLLLKFLSGHILFLAILLPIMIYTFYPIINIDFMDWDWLEIEYPYHVIPSGMPHLMFYLITPYGTAYALLGIAHHFFGSVMQPYYILNVFLRAIAAFTIYLFSTWWSKKKLIGIIAGLFFGVSIIGIENTNWVIQFPAYLGPIMLCVSLYFWKRFHDIPSKSSLRKSVIISGLAFFISHIRIYALPLIIMGGEFYQYIFNKTSKKYFGIKSQHILLLLIIFISPFVISYLILLLTHNLIVTENVFRVTSPPILFQSLINGFPPTIFTFFMFIGFLVFPPFFYPGPEIFHLTNIEDVLTILSLVMTGLSLGFLVFNLIKRQHLASVASILAVIYPVSFYLTQNKLENLEPAILISILVGGTIFILMSITVCLIWNHNRKIGELGLLALTIMITHLLLPWASFPIPQNNIQSAADPRNRYYLIPVIGICILWGIILDSSLNLASNYWQIHKPIIKKIFFPGNFLAFSIIIIIIYLLSMNSWVTHNFLMSRSSYTYNGRLNELWKIVRPKFESIKDKQSERVVYFEGDLSPKDINIIEYYMRHKLTVIGFHNPFRAHTVFFTSNKKVISSLIHQEPGSLALLGLSQPFSLDNFLALRFEKNTLIDIKKEIIKQL